MPSPIRVVVPIDSDDPQAWSFSAGYADAIATQAAAEAKDIVLLTHTKTQLKHTSLVTHMGEPAAKALLAGRTVSLSSGRQLRHATLQTLRGSGRGVVFIAYYADDGMLETIDGLSGVVGVVVVPWVADQIEGWTSRWNPKVHGQKAAATAVLITDPVVDKALTALSGWINLSHAVMHPRDKEHADETLRILRAKGHVFEPDKIKSWAIRAGWKPGAADELAKLATRVGGLKSKPSLSGYHDPQGKYERWSK